MRARLALQSANITVEIREIVLRNKPEAMLLASPKGTVPVLLDGDDVIDESLDIMFWALNQSDPEHLMPKETDQMNACKDWINELDNAFKPLLDRYKYFERHDGSQEFHRDTSLPFIEKLEAQLTKSPYLTGDHLTIADLAMLPFIRQYAHVDREWFFDTEFKQVQGWLTAFLESQRFSAVMKKYQPWSDADSPLYFPSATHQDD